MSEIVLKIFAVLIITASVTVLLKSYRPEYAMVLALSCAASVLVLLFKTISPQISEVKGFIEKSSETSGCFVIAVKALGITYLSSFTADLCRDFGQSSLASKAEFAGKCAVFALSLPLMMQLLQIALGFAGV